MREKPIYLVLLAAPATIWALHFMASYATASVYCAQYAATRDAPLSGVQIAIGVFTALALGGVGMIALGAKRRAAHGGESPPHDADTPEDRHRFLGLATALICGLAAVAVAYQALVFAAIPTCR